MLHENRRLRRPRVALGVALLALASASPLRAQSGEGYLFGAPHGSVSVRGGWQRPSAGGELFADLTSPQRGLTLTRSQFNGATMGAEIAVKVLPNLDLTFDAAYMSRTAPSNYRDLVDNNDQEIEQSTLLRRIPATVNARLYLAPRGRSVGRFAWIPNSVAPWVGAGAGLMWYRIEQDGDFVDDLDNSVFHDHFLSDGYTPMAQAMGGVDFTVSPRLAITGDARYLFAKRPTLSGDFRDYKDTDLSGVALSLGLTVRL